MARLDLPQSLAGADRAASGRRGNAMRRAPIIAIFMLPALLAACGPGNKQGTGTIVGAVAGGAAGAAIGGPRNRGAGLAIGAVVGGILGNQIGRSLDEEDRRMAAAAEYQALEYGQAGRGDALGTIPRPSIAARSCRASLISRAANFAGPIPTPSILAASRRPRGAPPAARLTAPGRPSARPSRTSSAAALLAPPARLRGINLRDPAGPCPSPRLSLCLALS